MNAKNVALGVGAAVVISAVSATVGVIAEAMAFSKTVYAAQNGDPRAVEVMVEAYKLGADLSRK